MSLQLKNWLQPLNSSEEYNKQNESKIKTTPEYVNGKKRKASNEILKPVCKTPRSVTAQKKSPRIQRKESPKESSSCEERIKFESDFVEIIHESPKQDEGQISASLKKEQIQLEKQKEKDEKQREKEKKLKEKEEKEKEKKEKDEREKEKKQKEKEEREKEKEKRQKEKEEREREKEKRQKEKEERQKEKEEKERLRKEEREQKEKERLEAKAVRDKEKQEKMAAREKERLLKEKEKQLKEQEKEEQRKKKQDLIDAKNEEKRKKDEEKQRELEEQLKKKEKAKQAFTSFFTKKSSLSPTPAPPDPAARRGPFLNFQIKSNMRLAPLSRRDFISPDSENLDNQLNSQNCEALYLPKQFSRLKDFRSSEKTWPLSDHLIILDSESETTKPRQRAKLFQFHENYRPAYYGTWQKRSKLIRPKNFLKKDEALLDYSVDSDDEWEEEEPGESLSNSEGEDEKEEEEEDDEDGFFVPHGYLSDDEGADEEDETLSPSRLKAKQLAKAKTFEMELKKKQEVLKPVINYASSLSSPSYLLSYKVVSFVDFPIPLNLPSEKEEKKKENKSSQKETKSSQKETKSSQKETKSSQKETKSSQKENKLLQKDVKTTQKQPKRVNLLQKMLFQAEKSPQSQAAKENTSENVIVLD